MKVKNIIFRQENLMKRTAAIANTVLTSVLILTLISVGWPTYSVRAASPSGINDEPELVCDTGRSVQVSGIAVVNVMPDRVLIQLGIQSNGLTPQIVEAENSKTINQVIKGLKKLGIEEKDIVTDLYVIDPIYKNYNTLHIKGYRINNVIAITLRDVSKVNKAISTSLQGGANEVLNVEFYLSDLRTYRDQARDLAMRAAKEKAQDLASAAGARTGCVMNINENTWSYYNSWGHWRRDQNNLWAQNAVQNTEPSGGGGGELTEAGPVNPGQISVRAEVSASFSLK